MKFYNTEPLDSQVISKYDPIIEALYKGPVMIELEGKPAINVIKGLWVRASKRKLALYCKRLENNTKVYVDIKNRDSLE